MSNPYSTPSTPPILEPGFSPPRTAPSLPVFCIVIFLLDLGFCALRLLMVAAGLIGLGMAAGDPMVARTGVYEVSAGAIMVAFGVPANIAMLLKQGWGVALAYVKVAATVGSIAVGLWQLTFLVEPLPPGSPERIGAFVGAGVMVAIRLALLGLYVAAVLRFSAWLKQQRPAHGGFELGRNG